MDGLPDKFSAEERENLKAIGVWPTKEATDKGVLFSKKVSGSPKPITSGKRKEIEDRLKDVRDDIKEEESEDNTDLEYIQILKKDEEEYVSQLSYKPKTTAKHREYAELEREYWKDSKYLKPYDELITQAQDFDVRDLTEGNNLVEDSIKELKRDLEERRVKRLADAASPVATKVNKVEQQLKSSRPEYDDNYDNVYAYLGDLHKWETKKQKAIDNIPEVKKIIEAVPGLWNVTTSAPDGTHSQATAVDYKDARKTLIKHGRLNEANKPFEEFGKDETPGNVDFSIGHALQTISDDGFVTKIVPRDEAAQEFWDQAKDFIKQIKDYWDQRIAENLGKKAPKKPALQITEGKTTTDISIKVPETPEPGTDADIKTGPVFSKKQDDKVVDLITKPLRDFHKDFNKRIADRVVEMKKKVDAYKDWQWEVGDRVKSNKTGKAYKINGRHWNMKSDMPLYRYESADGDEHGDFIVEKAHKLMTKMGGLTPVKFSKKLIKQNVAAEVKRVKKAKGEDGATFNVDGTTYKGKGLVVPVDSQNYWPHLFTSEKVASFIMKNEHKIEDGEVFKVGIYRFPDGSKYSVDLNVLVPVKYKDKAVDFARSAGQESVYDLGSGNNYKTGRSGNNTIKFTVEDTKNIARMLPIGKMPVLGGVKLSKAGEYPKTWDKKLVSELKQVRSNLASGKLKESSTEYKQLLKKHGSKIRGYTIRHKKGTRFVISPAGTLYGKVKATDDKRITKKAGITGEFKTTEYYTKKGKDGKQIIPGPILSENKRKRAAEIDSIIKKNKKSITWYQEWNHVMRDFGKKAGMSKDEIQRRIMIQAVLSASTGPQGNQKEFVRMIKILKSRLLKSGPLETGGDGVTKDTTDKINDIWKGQIPVISSLKEATDMFGDKVGAYMTAGLYPSDPNSIVIDRHMPRLWGINILWSIDKSPKFRVHDDHKQMIVDDIQAAS